MQTSSGNSHKLALDIEQVDIPASEFKPPPIQVIPRFADKINAASALTGRKMTMTSPMSPISPTGIKVSLKRDISQQFMTQSVPQTPLYTPA